MMQPLVGKMVVCMHVCICIYTFHPLRWRFTCRVGIMVSEAEKISLTSGYPQTERDVVLHFRESTRTK